MTRSDPATSSGFRETWLATQDAIPFPAYVADPRHLTLLAVNAAMHLITGAKVGEACHQAIYGQAERCAHCPLQAMLAETNGPTKRLIEHHDETRNRWYRLEEILIPWHDGRVAKYSIAVDTTDLRETRAALTATRDALTRKTRDLERLEVTDPMTGLSNRRRLEDLFALEVDRAERYGKPLSVILCDIDGFREINETLGHLAGDAVLALMAANLSEGVRHVDLVGRWGSEEFAILCPETNLEGALNLAEKLRTTVATCEVPNVGCKTASFGVASYRIGERPSDLMSRADRALTRAKERGRNRVEGERPGG